MAIFRGPGGSGDATGDSANQAQLAAGFATQAGVSATAAAGSATAAANSATTASNAATAAQTAQTAAELAETNAETAETNAETAQTAAEAAQTAAEAAQTAAEAAYDNFDDRYLGAKSSDPALDNDGNALVTGALYFNTSSNVFKTYTGSAWINIYAAGALIASNNLSDLTNTTTARQNLDLEIGVDVQAYDATILKSADIGVTVQGYDADTAKYDDATANFTGTLQNGGSNVVVDSDIGVTVQAYDATIVVDADIGVTVQGYDADTAKYDDTTANFSGTLQNNGSNVVVDSDIGSTVQAYDATIVVDADIGVTVQGYDADTAKYDDVTANFTGTLQNGGSNVLVDTDIGVTVQGYDADTVKTTSTQTLTNKRVNPRSVDASGTSGTITPNGDTTDIYVAEGLTGSTTFDTPSGTPVNGQKLLIRIKDNGTIRTLTWTATSGAFREIGITLPTATVANKTIYVGCVYNSADSFWDAVATVTQA